MTQSDNVSQTPKQSQKLKGSRQPSQFSKEIGYAVTMALLTLQEDSRERSQGEVNACMKMPDFRWETKKKLVPFYGQENKGKQPQGWPALQRQVRSQANFNKNKNKFLDGKYPDKTIVIYHKILTHSHRLSIK